MENELYSKSGNRQASQDVKVRDKVEKILDLEYIFEDGSDRISWWIRYIM